MSDQTSPVRRTRGSGGRGREMWLGLPVRRYVGLEQVRAALPRFERWPFAVTTGLSALTGENPNLHVIVRLPISDEAEIPVGVVSKSYSLIQHQELLQVALDALRANGVEEECRADLVMTELGERVDVRLTLPEKYNVSPDGEPVGLQLCFINSVDASTRLTFDICWLRFVCTNGLVVRKTTTRLQKIHNDKLDPDEVKAAVRAGLTAVMGDRERLQRWQQTPVEPSALNAWADRHVSRVWGVKAATRAIHIALTGFDVKLKPFESGPPSERTVLQLGRVPGMQTRRPTLYSTSQALAWLARDRRDHQERLDWMLQIPQLMDRLGR